MTQFEELKTKNIDELSEWLDKYGQFDKSPWMNWFNMRYCERCDPIMCKYKDGLHEFPCSYCELEDKCKFFPEFNQLLNNKQIIKLWLEAEVERCEMQKEFKKS